MAIVFAGAPALAAISKSSLKCRTTIAKRAGSFPRPAGVVAKVLKALDKCNAKRDKTGAATDCDSSVSVDDATGSTFTAAIGQICKSDDPVRSNYRSDPATAVLSAVIDAVKTSGADVTGAPNLGKDKAKRKCHAAIGNARSTIVASIVGADVKCQTAADKSASDLGALKADCVTSGSVIAKATAKIAKACGALTGADVGSCTPLPDCVAASAQDTATTIARAIYGRLCGDGVIESGEQCDDGNTVDGDSCSSQCTISYCGDHVVSAGEECDDGNIDNTDACTRVCPNGGSTDGCVCRAARCGDGFVQHGAEECDDGNDVAGDGCTNCRIDGAQCAPGSRIVATLDVNYDAVSRDMWGFELNLGYPASVSIPGSADISSSGRLSDILNTSFFLVGGDTDTNGDHVDDTLHVGYGGQVKIPSGGDVVAVTFDCASQAVLVGSSFTCAVTATSDPDGSPIIGTNTCAVHTVTVAP